MLRQGIIPILVAGKLLIYNKLVGEKGFEPPTPGPELGGAELILLVFNHLSGASTVLVLLNHASLGVT